MRKMIVTNNVSTNVCTMLCFLKKKDQTQFFSGTNNYESPQHKDIQQHKQTIALRCLEKVTTAMRES